MSTHVPEDPITVESLCAQIEDVGRKANDLIDGIREQRDDARAVLKAIADCVELRTWDGTAQVIEGKTVAFWALIRELKKVHS